MENVEIIQQQHEKTWFQKFNQKFAVASALTVGLVASTSVFAADIDLGIDAEALKTLILSLVATIALLGTAYLTVLVATSAFTLIRRVIRG